MNPRFAKQNIDVEVNIDYEPEIDVLGRSTNEKIGLINKKMTDNFKQELY